VRVLLKRTPEFNVFLAAKHVLGGPIDLTCGSILDFDDKAGYALTEAWLRQDYGHDPGAGQVAQLTNHDPQYSAAPDGWYGIDTTAYAWTGSLPYGQVTVAFQGHFAWTGGSFEHWQKNNNQMDGFGNCTGFPVYSGATVLFGYWTWSVYQV
jgi:hypothetical protein